MTDLDREKARAIVEYARNLPLADMDAILDRLEACVVPTTPDIDRDALLKRVEEHFGHAMFPGMGETGMTAHAAAELLMRDVIEALVRPAAGITLTPDEAKYVARWLPTRNSQRARALSAKLEAWS